jgi:hypothetical protein
VPLSRRAPEARRRAAITFALSLAAVGIAGCECASAEHASVRFRAAEPSAPDPEALPVATRDDLPAATPALTITIHRDTVAVDNRALVESWPSRERERARAGRPRSTAEAGENGTEWPIVRGSAALPDPAALRIDALATLLSRAAAVERAREGSSAAPIAYSIRAAARTPWRRIVQVMITAGATGWAEPRLLLRDASGTEVALAMPLAREPTGAPLTIAIPSSRDILASIATTPLAVGCGSIYEVAIDSVPARAGAIDRDALSRCLDAARGAGPAIHGATLAADGTIPFGELAPVLEAMRARYPAVEISTR